MTTPYLIHLSWLTPFHSYFAADPHRFVQTLIAHQIDPEQVQRGDGWISKKQLYRFLQDLAKETGTAEIGFLVGETMTPDTLGPLRDAMASAPTLGEALRIFCRVINRNVEGNRCEVKEGTEGEVWLLNHTHNPFRINRQIADHAGLMTLINLVRLAGGGSWHPREAALQTRRSTAPSFLPGFAQTRFRFSAEATGFPFPSAWLLHPVSLSKRAATSTPEIPSLLAPGESVAGKLERLVRSILGIGGISPTLALMADLCGMSSRSLQRQLQREGRGYRELLDQVRFDQAQDFLRRTELSVKEIAFELGYSGPNNFIRAFSRRAGMAPEAFRAGRR